MLISKLVGCQLQFGSILPQQRPQGQAIAPGMRQGEDLFKNPKAVSAATQQELKILAEGRGSGLNFS